MTRNSALVSALLLSVGAAASADVFSWAANVDGDWSNPDRWNGPNGQFPNSVNDAAYIWHDHASVVFDQNIALGFLSVTANSELLGGGHSVFVDGDVELSGHARLAIRQSPSLRELDADTIMLNNGLLVLLDALAQVDETMAISNGGAVLGTGIVEMNGSQNLVVTEGALWSAGTSGPYDRLLIRRTNQSTARLDMTSPDSGVIVWDGRHLENQLPYSGAIAGSIHVSGGGGTAGFISADPFVAGPTSEIRLYGDGFGKIARIEAPGMDSHGTISVHDLAVVDVPIVALRGSANVEPVSLLTLTSNLVILDSFQATGDGGAFQINSSATINVQGGTSTIGFGEGGQFDLDADGGATVNIDDNATLNLNTEFINIGGNDFSGTLNLEGELHVGVVNPPIGWTNNGDIFIEQGEISGRAFNNDGLVMGRGAIDSNTYNNGEIIADGGTLYIKRLDADGDILPSNAVIRAQTGDISVTEHSLDSWFSGDMFVGDGQGVREVFEMDSEFGIRPEDDRRGMLNLNSGRVMFHDFSNYGDLIANGVSRITVTGTEGADRIGFNSQGVNTIAGTLEVDGETWIVPGATFQGEGLVHAVSTVKHFYFQDDADLSDVSFQAASDVFITDIYNGTGTASMANMTLEPTAALNIDISGPGGSDEQDTFTVHDTATLDGDLHVSWTGFDPTSPTGERYTFLTASSVQGQFDAIDASGLGDNRKALVEYHADRVDLFVTCLADLTGNNNYPDGVVDASDYFYYLDLYANGDMQADIAGGQNGTPDGVLDADDFFAFLDLFAAGC